MIYKYSICHVDKEAIEYRNEPIGDSEVLRIAKEYPWIEKLEFSNSLNQDKVYYSPSLEFVCIENGRSYTLTAHYNKNKTLEFSLWFRRPKKVKVLFGLLGAKEKMVVDEFWSLDLEQSLKYLEFFVTKNYDKVEELFKT